MPVPAQLSHLDGNRHRQIWFRFELARRSARFGTWGALRSGQCWCNASRRSEARSGSRSSGKPQKGRNQSTRSICSKRSSRHRSAHQKPFRSWSTPFAKPKSGSVWPLIGCAGQRPVRCLREIIRARAGPASPREVESGRESSAAAAVVARIELRPIQARSRAVLRGRRGCLATWLCPTRPDAPREAPHAGCVAGELGPTRGEVA